MPMNSPQLVERLHVFTQKTLMWCADESEQATAKVTEAIGLLLQNTARVSALSAESLIAIKGMQTAISIRLNNQNRSSVGRLISSLEQLSKQHSEVEDVIHPIIRALQFQDRLRQNLENMVRLLKEWLAFRDLLPDSLPEAKVLDFAKRLAALTTMKAERDVIRRHFQGLEPELEAVAVTMF